MSDEQGQIWTQMEGEDDLWYGRFVAYLRLGTKRSVNAVFRRENNKKQQETTMFPGPTWYDASKTWKWKERARAYDEHVRAEEEKIIAAEKEKVLRSGFALMHERIAALDSLTRKLIGYTRDEEKVWLPDSKSIQTGKETYERVDFIHFNAQLFTMIDKYLLAIAAELGERVKKTEPPDAGLADTIVKVIWGRGTDPRKHAPDAHTVEQDALPDKDDEP